MSKTRHYLCWLLGSLLLLVASDVRADEKPSAPPPRFSLRQEIKVGDLSRVQSILEVSGKLKVNADGKQVIPLPLSARGELQFVEKLTSDGNSVTPRRAMRYYQTTSATSRIGEQTNTHQLANEHRWIAVQASGSEIALFSPGGPLSRDELELIDVQGNTLLLGRLLPEHAVAIGDRWTHDDALAALLLRLDVVTDNKLESSLVREDGRNAFLEMSGLVEGAVGGVSSKIEISAKYQFDQTLRRVTWLAMSLKEDRAVGHAEPGFEVTARLRVSIAGSEALAELGDEALTPLPQDPKSGAMMLHFSSTAANVRFVHDRNWRVMVDRHDVSILRFIERGDLLAQCNVSRLADAVPGKQLSVASFQADIRRVLDKSFGQIVESTESTNEKGLRTLRTVVSGVVADIPIQWTYYHLTDSQGRQASLVFTMDAKLVERFAAADQSLISSFEFTGPHAAATNGPPTKTAAGSPSPSQSTAR